MKASNFIIQFSKCPKILSLAPYIKKPEKFPSFFYILTFYLTPINSIKYPFQFITTLVINYYIITF